MVRRPGHAAAEAEEGAADGAAVRVGGAVQDAVQGGARVRPGDGRGAVQATGARGGAVGREDAGRAAGVARRGVAGNGAAFLRGARPGLRGLERAGVLPDGDERRGLPPDVPDADGGRPDALHGDAARRGGAEERHRVGAEPQPVVPARVFDAARRAAEAPAAERGPGEIQAVKKRARLFLSEQLFYFLEERFGTVGRCWGCGVGTDGFWR